MRRRVTIGWVILAFAIVVRAVPAAAQDDPAALASAYFADLAAERWEAATARLDPAALADWKAEVLEGLRRPPGFAVPTVEGVMAANPDMSRTVAEHFVSRIRPDPQRDVPIWFAGVESMEALARLEPPAAAARALEAASPAHQLSLVRDRRPAPPGGEGTDGGRVAERRRDVLGVVRDPDLAHVVYLDRWVDPMWPDAPPDLADHKVNVRVATARRGDDGWALQPGALLSRSGALVVTIYGSRPPGEPRPATEPPLEDPPAETAERFLRALDEDRWEVAAAFFSASDLERWHREIVRRIETSPKRESVEEILEREPDLPREVAEYRARQWPADPMGQMYPPIIGVETLDELRALAPVAAAAGALQGGDPGEHPAHVLANHGDRMPPEDAAAYRAMTGHDASRTILGTVPGPTPRDVQIVYRLRWGGEADYAIDEVAVLSLVATPDGWRVRRTGSGLLGETSREPTWPVIILETIRPVGPRPAPGSADESEVNRSDPEAVARAFLEAINTEDWGRAAALFDETALGWWYGNTGRFLEERRSQPMDQQARAAMLHRLGIESVDEWGGITPLEAAERQLRGRYSEQAFREFLAKTVPGADFSPHMFSRDRSLVGVVRGSDEMAYAVYLERPPEPHRVHRSVENLILQRRRGAWAILPQRQLLGGAGEPPPELDPK
ncbi:MAG TPA: hypothetical protein VM778_06880 [Gemmatimonadota bacterium]|nr:hypothetical protein [Gemmatimonadota bacterium]